jgi:hypothetical protein
MKKLKELDDVNQQQEIMRSPTKPGTGWVRVTPELIKELEDSRRRMRLISLEIEKIVNGTLAEMDDPDENIRNNN